MLEFLLTPMTHADAQPRDKSNIFKIITIKKVTCGMSNKSAFAFSKFQTSLKYEGG